MRDRRAREESFARAARAGRQGRRGRTPWVALPAALSALLVVGVTAADPVRAPGVRLKSGRLLQGHVRGEVSVQGASLLEVETDYGRMLVPKGEVEEAAPAAATDADATFSARSIRVVRIEGKVERRPKGSPEWQPLAFVDPYGKRNRHDEMLRPGDSARTGPDGSLDLMLHKDAWVRLSSDTEVLFPEEPAKGSLSLLRGTSSQQVTGRPRGETFRVHTPSAVLGVKGTVFSVTVDPGGEGLALLEGAVEVQGRGTVAAGRSARWEAQGPLAEADLSVVERRALERPFLRYPEDDMVYVPGGTYRLGGTAPGDPPGSGRAPIELRLPGFWIDRCEVSRADGALFRRATGFRFSHGMAVAEPEPGTEGLPLIYASPAEAQEFARWCQKDLPTEIQWEAAARGPRGYENPWGPRDLPQKARRILPPYRRDPNGYLTSMDSSAALGSVRGPTDDVSPFGCLQMASNAPELCLARTLDAASASPEAPQERPAPTVQRGVGNHVLGRAGAALTSSLPAGFRCVLREP